MKRTYSCIFIATLCSLSLLLGLLLSCGGIETPNDTKYLEEFHRVNFETNEKYLQENKLNLFVDYSTCNMLGQNSPFFQDIAASFVNKTSTYYSIKGNEIKQEQGDVYTLLRNIEEVNYAELAKAAQMMAESDCESVMITDGEYYTPSIAKGHDNDPYLANAFKTWILKGYDIHIISEPYVEPYNGQSYNKKRFYIIFTDDRMQNNIFDRINRTVDFTQYPDVDIFHISASHPQLMGYGNNCSAQDSTLNSKSKGLGSFEIEDWDGCDWKTIESVLVNGSNNDYEEEENQQSDITTSTPIIQMGIDRNSFGCYRIKSINLKVYDINQEYSDYYTGRANGGKPIHQDYTLNELPNFMQIDAKEFEKHSKINISFDPLTFDPEALSGKPYNYLKLDLTIGEVQPIFDQHQDKFEFESITRPGTKNVSVASSIKQCLADDKVIGKMKGQVIYSIYIKSERAK